MMNLPPEVKVDILKYFNFNQLLTIQQTNSYFNEFINANENQLALKKFVYIHFSCVNGSYLYNYLFDPAPKLYDFELSKGFEEKWKCGIEKSLPMFLIENNNNSCMIFYDFLKNREEDTNNLEILFPNIPKNIEEMKIARYLFQQLFTCAFEFVHFYHGIINPQMVELLFDDNKLNIPLQIHSECSYIYMFNSNYDNCLLLKSIFNHMLSNDFIIIGIVNDQTLETLFKFVTNGENNFNRVYFNQNDYPKLNDFIIKHIETGDVFKMVRKLIFSVTQKPIISKHAKNIEIKVGDNNLKCTKYQLSNKWDPEMKFCIYNREKAIYVGSDLRPAFDVEIKRTN